jgi:TetR/AcrR family transcriptional regulator, mexJK operon transcriptional repressor
MTNIVPNSSKKEISTRYQAKAAQILKGALPEFLEHGYAGATMDRVAQMAGVSKQTLYSYYADKEGLFNALVKKIAEEKYRMVWTKPLEGKPEQVLRELAYRLLSEAEDEDYVNFIRMMMAESGKRPELSQVFVINCAKPAIDNLSRYLAECPELKIQDAEATARIFIGSLIHYLIVQVMFRGAAIIPMAEERMIDRLIELIVDRE